MVEMAKQTQSVCDSPGALPIAACLPSTTRNFGLEPDFLNYFK